LLRECVFERCFGYMESSFGPVESDADKPIKIKDMKISPLYIISILLTLYNIIIKFEL